MKFCIINGPNLYMLGIREPDIYGRVTYEDLVKMVKGWGQEMGIETECYQSNHEGDLVDKIQQCYFDKIDGIVINPGAYTHTSIALLDAVKSTAIPTVEIHISDVTKREDFRRTSYIRMACVATVMGQGLDGYRTAMQLLKDKLRES